LTLFSVYIENNYSSPTLKRIIDNQSLGLDEYIIK